MTKSIIRQVVFFCKLSLGVVIWPRVCSPVVSQNPISKSAGALEYTEFISAEK